MDFIYICRPGENEELRYSIRSVVSYFKDANIIIYGSKPQWYYGEYHEVPPVGNKYSNIRECYRSIANNYSGNNFVAMNDDFFFLKKTKKIPYIYDGTLQDKIKNHIKANGHNRYTSILSNAEKLLIKMGVDMPLNYDVHTPMIMNTKNLGEIVDLSEAPRSIYGNVYQVGGIQSKDVKVYGSKIILTNDLFISSLDRTFPLVKNLIGDNLLSKTIYEKD